MKNMMRIVFVLKRVSVEESFSWPNQNLTEMVRYVGKLEIWGILVSIFEMDQNWN